MVKIIVDKIPKEAKECPFAEYIAITNKHCCMFQKGLYARCDLECGTKCEYLKEKKMIRGFQEVKKEFKKHNEAVPLPTRGSKYSAGYDFYSPERIVIQPFGKSDVIATDVKAYMQEGEVLILHVRSSIGIKRGLTLSNCTGVIDKDFYSNPDNDGNICFVLQNNTDKKQVIEKGERVMQGIFMPFLIADDDEATSERLGGIGSSGK